MNREEKEQLKQISRWIKDSSIDLSTAILKKIMIEHPLETWNQQTATLLPVNNISHTEDSILIEFNERGIGEVDE